MHLGTSMSTLTCLLLSFYLHHLIIISNSQHSSCMERMINENGYINQCVVDVGVVGVVGVVCVMGDG